MALAHAIYIPEFTIGPSIGGVIRVVQGGSTTIPTLENVTGLTTPSQQYVRNVFVWDGNIYMPLGHWQSSVYGWTAYNPVRGSFQHDTRLNSTIIRPVGLNGLLGFVDAAGTYCSGPSMRYVSHPGSGVGSISVKDYVILGDTVFGTDAGTVAFFWSYPFTAPPSTVAATIERLAVFNGKVYGLGLASGSVTLYEWTGGTWTTIGSFVPADSADLNYAYSTYACFFAAGGKLWALLSYNTGAVRWHRLYEIDETTGTGVDQSAALLDPNGAWTGVPTHNFRMCFEVIDDTGPSRLVYLFSHNYSQPGGWECWEFDGANPVTAVATNAGQRVGASAGALWAPGAGESRIISAADSSPSNYATLSHKCSNLQNTPIDIDIRYWDVTGNPTDPPPHQQCTEKTGVGSEGKSALTTVPPGVTVLSDLDDDFADSIIDPVLWEPVNWGVQNNTTYGDQGYRSTTARTWMNLSESPGALVLGGVSPAPILSAGGGVGVKSRWWISGEFQIDAVINLANLVPNVSRFRRIALVVRTMTNEGYAMSIFHNTTNYFARIMGFKPSVFWFDSVDSASPAASGMTIRISRDALNNWSFVLDALGTPVVIAPPIGDAFADPVHLMLVAFSIDGANFASADPGPGFTDLQVSGLGSLVNYEGGVDHQFMWDHITDLGAGIATSIQFFSDTDNP